MSPTTTAAGQTPKEACLGIQPTWEPLQITAGVDQHLDFIVLLCMDTWLHTDTEPNSVNKLAAVATAVTWLWLIR